MYGLHHILKYLLRVGSKFTSQETINLYSPYRLYWLKKYPTSLLTFEWYTCYMWCGNPSALLFQNNLSILHCFFIQSFKPTRKVSMLYYNLGKVFLWTWTVFGYFVGIIPHFPYFVLPSHATCTPNFKSHWYW